MNPGSNTGHGHVRPRPDGAKARCGGPGICGECARERAAAQEVVTGKCGTVHWSLAEWQACCACDRADLAPLWDVDAQALASVPADEVPSLVPVGELGAPVKAFADTFSGETLVMDKYFPERAAAPDIWMQSLDGRAVDLVNPTPAMIHWSTIATVLARIPRFGGHTRNGTYSVAQHCEQGARAILRDTGDALAAAAFLIHDAHEAYIGDVTTPVQRALAKHAAKMWEGQGAGLHVVEAFRSLKAALDAAIFPAAGLPWSLPPEVHAAVKVMDIRMMVTERDARLAPPPYPWAKDAPRVVGCDLERWSEGLTMVMYENACRELLPALKRPKQAVPIARDLCGNS